MVYKKEILIEAAFAPLADEMVKDLETIASTLDQGNIKFLADLCREKGKSLNGRLRSKAKVIKNNL